MTSRHRCFRPWPMLIALCIVLVRAMCAAPETISPVAQVFYLGFGPFAGRTENASWQSVAQFAERKDVEAIHVPVVWGEPRRVLAELEKKITGPCVFVALGEGTPRYHVELVAFNQRASVNDEAKAKPPQVEIETGGPSQRLTLGPAEQLAAELVRRGHPARVSKDAGRFLCNEMLYELLRLQERDSRVKGAFFIHVPVLGQKVKTPAGQIVADKAFCAKFGADLDAVMTMFFPRVGALTTN